MTADADSTAALLLGITAAMALTPITLLSWRGEMRAWLFWVLHAVALSGVAAALAQHLATGWSEHLVQALWLSLLVVLLIYPLVAWRSRGSPVLAPLLYPYLLALAIAATLLEPVQPHEVAQETVALSAWLAAHIVFALLAYGLVTLAALAGLAVVLQEMALKRRRPSALSARLPALADGERLQFSLLAWAELGLALAIASGMAHQVLSEQVLLRWDHKTLLVLLGFLVIGLLLILSRRTGLRGRRAARIVLTAYLLLTLAYPGVKFVSDLLAT
ncbi:MAG: cytochrome c biogenesis protein CcsA [Kiloniellales bacterium]